MLSSVSDKLLTDFLFYVIWHSNILLYYQRKVKTQSKHCQKAKQKALNVDTLRLFKLYYLVSLFTLNVLTTTNME